MQVNKKKINNFSSIRISEDSKNRLKALALTPHESYENIILRLTHVNLGNRKIKYKIEYNNASIFAQIDWGGNQMNIKWLGEDNLWKYNFPKNSIIFDDVVWEEFYKKLSDDKYIIKLINNLSILDYGESMCFDDLMLERID